MSVKFFFISFCLCYILVHDVWFDKKTLSLTFASFCIHRVTSNICNLIAWVKMNPRVRQASVKGNPIFCARNIAGFGNSF